MKINKKRIAAILISLIIVGIKYFFYDDQHVPEKHHRNQTPEQQKTEQAPVVENKLPANDNDNIMAEPPGDEKRFISVGRVIRVLPDDTTGIRHQRFILELGSGRKILIAHNIDIAPRIPGLRVGDTIGFNGIFKYNEKGGLVHWTHHDPSGRHPGGWLKRGAKIYR